MSSQHADQIQEDVPSTDEVTQGPSAMISSEPVKENRPIDCVLVYDSQKSSKDNELEPSDTRLGRKPVKQSAERRKAFEDYLSKKQGLVIENIVSHRIRANPSVSSR